MSVETKVVVNNWYPPFELQQEIRRANAQLAIVQEVKDDD